MNPTTPAQIALSLISHTNVGKTALARTLLGRDVGEVRDEAHVTATADRYPMVESRHFTPPPASQTVKHLG